MIVEFKAGRSPLKNGSLKDAGACENVLPAAAVEAAMSPDNSS
jgi:hypothetical protein